MARYVYERLSALDNSFLLLENANAYMHVASTQIFEAGPLRRPDGGIDAERIRDVVEAGLHRIPRYRQKLARIPITGHPVWVDDERFHIDYHVRHTSLPRPGTEEQLKRLSARLMQQHLDRARPLWEMWIIEGLEGDRFALVSKVHHCMIDGISGVDLMRILMSPTPETTVPEKPRFIPRPAPTPVDLLREELLRRSTIPLQAVRGLQAVSRQIQEARLDTLARIRALAGTLGTTLQLASDTPLNRPIGPHRRFDWLTTDLGALRAVRRALGGSLNDVVLTVVTGAVRRFLRYRQVDPDRVQFRVMAPVSVRAPEERGTLGNRVSAWIVELPLAERDPRVRLERIAASTAALKRSAQAVGAQMLIEAAEWTSSTLLALGARNVTRLLPFNMVVTNVPGPQFPIYLSGARMLETYPHVPLYDRLGLNIALMSYDGKLCWGFNGDWDLVPDLDRFVRATEESLDELLAAAPGIGAEKPPAVAEARPRRRKPRQRAARA